MPSRALLIAFAFFGSACGGVPVTGPGPSGLTVQASLAAVALAEDCPTASLAAPSGDAAQCQTPGNCPSLCQQSSLQIDLVADNGGGHAVGFEVVAVRVYDSTTRSLAFNLVPREPQRWSGNAYLSWDQQIAPAANLKVSYKVSAPDWSSTSGLRAQASSYLVEVDVRIDGVVRTLSLDGVTREPIIAT